MKLVADPSIERKIAKMQERLRWNHPLFDRLGIDRTQLVLDNRIDSDDGFTFCVLGDSGNGVHRGDSPQRRVAELMMRSAVDARFILHTGDVVYLVGSSEQYPENFIKPYRELLVGGDRNLAQISYDSMVFNRPFLPVLGNHDYYDLPIAYGVLSQILRPLRQVFRYAIDLDVGWHGSYQGDAYARAFLDYLKDIPESALQQHLERHYTAQTATGKGLNYQSGKFTRLPNRYYQFRYGGIDFFALDSNTFNVPLPIESDRHRQTLLADLDRLQAERDEHLQVIQTLDPHDLAPKIGERESLDELLGKVEQIEELIGDLEKQLDPNVANERIDIEQLEWLERGLVASWEDKTVRGRMIYFHHPPYVTEATKWHQGQTLAVRHYLRMVFDRVELAVKPLVDNRPLVDLVMCGHAHCFEYLETLETGHADRGMKWAICGGSGFSLRRQRTEGNILQERVGGKLQDVAVSHQFLGKTGRGANKYHAYSCLQVDVLPGRTLKFQLKPQVAEYHQLQWRYYASKLDG
ncbi:metallophosphoesterase [Chamaesiphon sp. VAR_48_metabat_403]|uniref:metallophosphoesterase n=1 Tax=Chamaesiphon sp. VAR_48_metabat_403 TaxID=2964700 RepID=UPI00286E434C|nr:metallophosphoesterase [Chamaesiphon sp. VAR_48_metabat_403]